jgi:hypothetical protein
MSALSIQPTFPIFTETNGLPLENGYIWIGAANLDPQGNPINVYWDAALTIQAAQPIRTLNGYPSRSGTPARLYVNSDYSIRVQNSKGSLVYSAPEALERYSSDLVSFTGFKGQIGTVANLADDDGSDWIGFDPVGASAVARSAQDKMRDVVSVKDFGASPSATAAANTAAFQAAIDSSQNAIIFVPAGTYQISGTLNVLKPGKLIIRGDGAFNADRQGTRLDYTGTGTLFECGAEDGNPDSVGFTGDVRLEHMALVTTAGAVGAKFSNCRYVTIDHCVFLGWTDKVVWLNGGNIIIKIIDSELFGSGNTATSAPYAIYSGGYQFGNFDTRIERCHISNCGTIAKLGTGRGYHFLNCTIDGAGLTGFDCDGYRPTIFNCQNNYFENVAGQFFTNGTAQPGFLEFTFCNNEVWPASPVTIFGDLTKVSRMVLDNNFIPDAQLKALQSWLGLGNVYTSISLLAESASMVRAPYTNKEYEDFVAYQMQRDRDLLRGDGNFSLVTAGTPTGWTNLGVTPWLLVDDDVIGTKVCKYPIVTTEFLIADTTVSFTPLDIAEASKFVIAYYVKGWAGLDIDGNIIIDAGKADWSLEVTTFTVPAGNTSFTARLRTNTVDVYVAEMRVWQIGTDDFNEPGILGEATRLAAVRNVKRFI